jgi:hypothetical protein
MQLRVVEEGEKRGIHVDWARRGRSDLTLWDESGYWKGMPERIEQAVYEGLTKDQQDEIERAWPTSFGSASAAIAWGVDQGVFKALQHGRNAYDELKARHNPQTAQEMWDLWIADVRERSEASRANGSADANQF